MAGMTPGRLAKELGVRPMEMFKTMGELRLNVKRMGATLTTAQEDTLRRHYTNVAAAQQQAISRAEKTRPPTETVPRTAVPVVPVVRSCSCCNRRWQSSDEDLVLACPPCRGHSFQADEPPERRIARLESHMSFMQAALNDAREDVSRAQAETQTAYVRRWKWMTALVEVVLDHDEGSNGVCWCGGEMPCRTWRRLEKVNRGIHREVEKWSSWDDDRLDKFLYGDSRPLDEPHEELDLSNQEPAD